MDLMDPTAYVNIAPVASLLLLMAAIGLVIRIVWRDRP